MRKQDALRLLIALHALVVSVLVYGWLSETQWPLRIASLIGGIVVSALIILMSDMGRSFIAYAKSSIQEGRKVVWPSRQESIRSLLVVVLFTLILALFLWVVDLILFWIFNDILLSRG